MDQQVQPFPYAVPKYIRVLCRKLLLGKNSGPNGIINIMVGCRQSYLTGVPHSPPVWMDARWYGGSECRRGLPGKV